MKIAEIFPSIHGEINGHHQGMMCTFIRTSGCNLKCWYCDTAHTQDSNYGTEMSVLQIIRRVKELGNKYVCLTGGEPLLNKHAVLDLLYWLWQNKFIVSVETNGTIDINPFFRYVDSFVIDDKVEIEDYKKHHTNYLNLRKKDVIKFVVNQKSFQKALDRYYLLQDIYATNSIEPIFAFSPIISKNFSAKDLYSLLRDRDIRNVVISLQIHKIADFY
jgi:7-carboxy-7-deazaguanine synthase